MPNCWKESLQQTLNQLQKRDEPPRVAVLGIGQTLRGDDGVGVAVARALRPFAAKDLLVIEAAHAPENCTGEVRRFAPDLVLLIDAAQMNEPPGTIRWLDWRACDGLSASTHTMPLTMLGRYLTAVLPCQIALIGIQPAALDLAETLAPEVAEAALEVAQTIGNASRG